LPDQDLVEMNFMKATRRIFPDHIWGLICKNPTIMRILKDQFRDNLRKINSYVVKTDVTSFESQPEDHNLFERQGADFPDKSKIPDPEDFRILLYAKSISTSQDTFIVTADKVFTRNISLIERQYGSIVIPEEKL